MARLKNSAAAKDFFPEHKPGEPEVLGSDAVPQGTIPKDAFKQSEIARNRNNKNSAKAPDMFSEDKVSDEPKTELVADQDN